MADKWKLCVLGNYREGWEISAVRTSNKFGFESYGWFDKKKILISEGNNWKESPPKEIRKLIWASLKAHGASVVEQLNKLEGN